MVFNDPTRRGFFKVAAGSAVAAAAGLEAFVDPASAMKMEDNVKTIEQAVELLKPRMEKDFFKGTYVKTETTPEGTTVVFTSTDTSGYRIFSTGSWAAVLGISLFVNIPGTIVKNVKINFTGQNPGTVTVKNNDTFTHLGGALEALDEFAEWKKVHGEDKTWADFHQWRAEHGAK